MLLLTRKVALIPLHLLLSQFKPLLLSQLVVLTKDSVIPHPILTLKMVSDLSNYDVVFFFFLGDVIKNFSFKKNNNNRCSHFLENKS